VALVPRQQLRIDDMEDKKRPHRATGKKASGRPVGAISAKRRAAHEILEALEKEIGPCHPLELMLRAGADPNIPLEIRATLWKDACSYLVPRLEKRAVELSGPNEGPLAVAALDVTQIMMNPELSDMAHKLLEAIPQPNPQLGPWLPPD